MLIAIASVACPPALLAAQATPSQSAAGSDRVAIARALFEEGLAHIDAQRWALAADCFSRMLQLRYSAVAAYNLALSQARLGNPARAVEQARELLAQPALEPTVRQAASDLLDEQQEEVAWLELRLSADCEGCAVQVDERQFDQAALSQRLPVNPGRHVLRLMQDSEQRSSAQVDVTRGQRLVLALEPGQPMAAEPIAAPSASVAATTSWERSSSRDSFGRAPPRDGETEDDSSPFVSPWFWAAVGVVAAGSIALAVGLGSGEAKPTPPVPGDFSPGVVMGVVDP